MDTVAHHKVTLRKELRAQRLSLAANQRASAEALIVQEIKHQLTQYPKGLVGVYAPFDGEVDLSLLWNNGERTDHLPFCATSIGDHKARLVFPTHKVGSPLSFIKPTAWDRSRRLSLPIGPKVDLEQIRLLFIPGLAFCPQTGLRLGLGGGHYDRTLAHNAQSSWTLKTFGVGFNFQLRSDLPREPWDIPLDALITESGLHTPRLDT